MNASANGLEVALVGATGIVGSEILKILEERRFPVKALRAFASERSVGKSVSFAGRSVAVEVADPEAIRDHDVVFLSAGATLSRELRASFEGSRARVYDNTSAFRLEPSVPLVVPEVNGQELTADCRYASVPNCTTILLTLALHPLHQAFGLRRVVVSTYQAISGAGAQALEDLLQDTRAHLEGADVAPSSLAFNLIPRIGPTLEKPGGGWQTGEEDKVVAEARRILGVADLPLAVTCVRVPVLRAHSESVMVEMEARPSLEEVRSVLRGAPGVELRDDLEGGIYPTPRQASGIDGIHVGRLRFEPEPSALSFFLSGDQLRKGAALNAIQMAEQQRQGGGVA